MLSGSVKEFRWALFGLLSLFLIALLCVAMVAKFGWLILMIESSHGMIVLLGGAALLYFIFIERK